MKFAAQLANKTAPITTNCKLSLHM